MKPEGHAATRSARLINCLDVTAIGVVGGGQSINGLTGSECNGPEGRSLLEITLFTIAGDEVEAGKLGSRSLEGCIESPIWCNQWHRRLEQPRGLDLPQEFAVG
jgi:hypothetical protein